jgi:hypothetical protein
MGVPGQLPPSCRPLCQTGSRIGSCYDFVFEKPLDHYQGILLFLCNNLKGYIVGVG